jgi:membrane protein
MSDEIDLRDPPDRGRQAESPTEIPKRGWRDVLARTAAEAKADQVVLLAAGVAFFALLALVPGLVAAISIYGLVSDPADVSRHVNDLLGAAPSEVRELVEEQLRSIAAESSSSIGVGALGGLVAALWSASSGMKHAIDAMNAAYDEEEGRGFLKVRGLSLLFTLGAIVVLGASVAVLTIVPNLLEGSALGDASRLTVSILRWPLLAGLFAGALAILYRYGPSRDQARWRWVTPGAGLATVAWLLLSSGFALYTSNFASYDETYGTLGSIVVVMLWLFLTALVVVLGAELDAELERQTQVDSTGDGDPMGHRDAHAADTVGPDADAVKRRQHEIKAQANR